MEAQVEVDPNIRQTGAEKLADKCGAILERLINVNYDHAKRRLSVLLAIQIVIYLAGILAVFLPSLPLGYPAVALGLLLISEWFSADAAKFKGIAETLKRQHEYWQGFGESPSKGQLANVRVIVKDSLSEEDAKLLQEGLKFSSDKPFGAARMLENLCESAWFSQHLAGWCSRTLQGVFVITLVAAILALVAIATSTGNALAPTAAKCISSTLAFVVSIGILKSWLAFAAFSQKSKEVEAEAQRLLEKGAPTDFEAQRILAEYQIARGAAPSIPTWMWKWKREKLDHNWNELKRRTE
jgi:hypothetical protein